MEIKLILISTVLFISCGTKEKEVASGKVQGENKVERVLSSPEIESKETQNNEASSVAVNDEQHTKAINSSSEEIVDKNYSKRAAATDRSSSENPELIENSEKETISIPEERQKLEVVGLDHGSWDQLLKKYVDDAGNVAYKNFKKDLGTLEDYLDYLAKNKPSSTSLKNEILAYYINLYNAATIKLILDNYPTNSIKDLNSPWDKKWVQLEDKKVSLGHIEHKILRKMDEPRIHFAINCASYSCPKLVNEAFTASNMERLLEKATIDFIEDSSKNKIEANRLALSNIFKWYKKDFTNKVSLKEYIARYSTVKINAEAKISYLKYDWSLNEKK